MINPIPFSLVGLMVEFYIDDVSEHISLEGIEESSVNSQTDYQGYYSMVKSVVEKLRSQEWFMEGNKTEGTITFHSEHHISVQWKCMSMGTDWDTDEEEEYSQDCIINPDTSTYKTIEL